MTTKQRILAHLEQQRGTPVSGELLAQALGLTRAAVWKAVQDLQKDGHAIVAKSRQGYTLSPESDVLSEGGLRPYLVKKDVTIVAAQSLASTNITAKEIAAQGAPHGSLAVAETQTAGRGRRGRSFSSPPGTGLYMSVVLRGGTSMQGAALVTSAAAVAVCRALHSVCGKDDVQIKWVNDLFTGGKKCCGILTEAAADMETGGVDYLVTGIGLNLREPPGGFEPAVAKVAGALFAADAAVPRCRLAAAIANELIALYEALPDTTFMQEYRARNLVPGNDIWILQNDKKRPAHALSITDEGHLLVRLPDGSEEALSFGEISIRVRRRGSRTAGSQ